MRHFLLILSVLGCIGIAGCDADGLKTVESGNKGVTSEVLAVVEGRYRVYRVDTGSRYIYFVTDNGAPLTTSWSESCGRNCVENVQALAVTK